VQVTIIFGRIVRLEVNYFMSESGESTQPKKAGLFTRMRAEMPATPPEITSKDLLKRVGDATTPDTTAGRWTRDLAQAGASRTDPTGTLTRKVN
jgi:hypothetical protein